MHISIKKGLLLCAVSSAPVFATQRPNVLLIVSDDQGWGDVGFNGCTDIPTPNLDQLAKSGVVFSHGYVSHPYCSPSRAGLLSGRNIHFFGHECNPENTPENEDSNVGLPLNQLLMPELLHANGYKTCAIGKWHLGNAQKFWPTSRGFDDWFGFTGGGFNYWGTLGNNAPIMGILRNGVPVSQQSLTYLTDDFSKEAVNYIGNYSKQDKPFFMYLAYNAPHAPIQNTKQYANMVEFIENGTRAAYAAMVVGMDAGIGKVVDKLKETGAYDNTIIVFLSDNGGHGSGASSLPFRGMKGNLFEGGIRVPFLISWPAKIKGGSTYKNAMIAYDIFPTILAATGIKHPNPQSLDGVNLLPLLNSHKSAKRAPMYWRYSDGAGYAVLDGKYKLVNEAYRPSELYLFDIEADPYEHHNLVSTMPDKVAELKGLYAEWSKKTINGIWTDDHMPHVKEGVEARKAIMDASTRGDKSVK